MANHTVKWNNTELKAVIQNLLCPRAGEPKVYALDTEFSLRRTAPEVTAVAFVDIRSGRTRRNVLQARRWRIWKGWLTMVEMASSG